LYSAFSFTTDSIALVFSEADAADAVVSPSFIAAEASGDGEASGDADAVGLAVVVVVVVVVVVAGSEAETDGEEVVVALGCWHEAIAKAMDTGNNKRPAKCLIIFDFFEG
jgi:hypothetical protein